MASKYANYQPYKKGVDITAWVLQFLVCIILLAISIIALVAVKSVDDGTEVYDVAATAAGVSIAIIVVCIIINIVEIVFIAKKKMPPALYLSLACIKFVIWLIVFIVEILGVALLGIILALICVVTSGVQLGFGAKFVHVWRKEKRGEYSQAFNPGHVETGNYIPPQNNYGVPQQPTGYTDAQYPPQVHPGAPYNPGQQPISAYQSPAQHQGMYQPPQEYKYPHDPNSFEMSTHPAMR
ncbi:hypothetical protein F5Y18DRAFT_346613 [Xylariaceae sp. FL1019]|nr:hypothetical protein F5Y18DRAFT_346613 [Xylariaceae sp. FL1019]